MSLLCMWYTDYDLFGDVLYLIYEQFLKKLSSSNKCCNEFNSLKRGIINREYDLCL